MNWGQLKAAIAGYLHRTDAEPLLPTWLALAEQRIYFGEQNTPALRLAAMLKHTTLTAPARPADFLAAKKVYVTGPREIALEYRPLEHLPHDVYAFSWDGQNMVLGRLVGWPVELLYYARLTTPVADADTNWLLQNAPGVYLSAMLIEAAKWSRDDGLLVREVANYTSAATALLSADRVAQHSGSALTMRTQMRVA